MNWKKIDWEKVYFGALTLFVLGILVYKYIAFGCVLICGDWYDD